LSGKQLVKGVMRAFPYRLLAWIVREWSTCDRGGWRRGRGSAPAEWDPRSLYAAQKGGDSGEWVTQLERSPAPADGPRPASRSASS